LPGLDYNVFFHTFTYNFIINNMKKLFFFFVLSWYTVAVFAQQADYVKITSGKVVYGEIKLLTNDTIYIIISSGNQKVNTHVLRSDVVELYLHQLNLLSQSLDTSLNYIITLKDNTKLTGKITALSQEKIVLTDVVFGIVVIKAEYMASFIKETGSEMYHIVLHNGNELNGQLIERRASDIRVKTNNIGEVTIPNSEIKRMEPIKQDQVKGGKYWFDNPNATRYLFAPSAINLNKGEAYYQNTYIIGNSINYGVTDNISIGGIVILPLIALITPKIGFEVVKNFHLGGGIIAGILPESNFTGIVYGVATLGSKENNFTLGGGYGFVNEEFTKSPIITLNGMARVGRKVALVTENWVYPYYDEVYLSDGTFDKELTTFYIISYGVRIMRERVTFDIALLNNSDISEFVFLGIPYIDFVFKF